MQIFLLRKQKLPELYWKYISEFYAKINLFCMEGISNDAIYFRFNYKGRVYSK